MSYEIEILIPEEGVFLKKDFCLRQAVAFLEYRDANGRAYARIPEGATYTLADLKAELGKLAPDEDCDGCKEKKTNKKK
jgi:hypothetical protein